jgi:hypothetical protein
MHEMFLVPGSHILEHKGLRQDSLLYGIIKDGEEGGQHPQSKFLLLKFIQYGV